MQCVLFIMSHSQTPEPEPWQIFKLKAPLGTMGKKPHNNNMANSFLTTNPLAKIVIVVDTHSFEDGGLVCGEDKDGTSYSDHLGKVWACSLAGACHTQPLPSRFFKTTCHLVWLL